MTKDLACRMARAFCAGLAFSHGAGMALDAAQWITVHPNGKGINAKGDNIKGRPCLIDSETGEILGGMGGKFTGRHISAMAQKGANEQPGAQMQITARNPKHKAEAMNGQRIGFKQVNGATAQSRSDFGGKKNEYEHRILQGATLKPGHLHLSVPMKIEKQTDKAVMTRDAKDNKIWLPKSQASITDTGYIAGVSGWAAKEKGIQTEKPADQPNSHTGAPSGGASACTACKKESRRRG